MNESTPKQAKRSTRHPYRTPTLFLSWMQTLRKSGLRSTQKATTKRQAKNQARQALLQQEMRHLLLEELELEQEQKRLSHRLEELSPRPVLEQGDSLLFLTPVPPPSQDSLQWFLQPLEKDSTP
jgi:hypothetical protein